MKTLDPDDWAYDGNYDNAYDGHDGKKAKGFNYHQGPEWLWLMGYFLRAKLHFAKDKPDLLDKTVQFIQQTLSAHQVEMEKSPWRGLPELTNKDGVKCTDSCPTQAWSMGCILDVLYDLDKVITEKT
ncbi:glycogen debranching enzyme-like [Saccoglossus kowalevskii]|uniref:Glycogen debranching enzyme-like n=1 Tax=Saccoglossus kowalevskii TaxID=10224 RepID=A0ABM0M7W6_SACKO|nr:PREDICTED: glycogen debranching enzyme-like [Saccoglossus kowalevskii]